MIYHIMADGTRRDSLEGYILPEDISESVLKILYSKEDRRVITGQTRIVEKE